MEIKIIEIRDIATMIAALCVNMNPGNIVQHYYLRRYGYRCDGEPNIMITHANGGQKADNDPYSFNDRTWRVAHQYIINHWHELSDGSVVDVEYILGETKKSKISERLICGPDYFAPK